MSIIDYFKHNAEYWVGRINTEGKLGKSEVKLALEFVTNAFKWECFSSADRVAKELQNKGYAVYTKDIKERNFKATVDDLIKDNSRVCIHYIKTFTPEIIYNEEYVIIYYTSENGERFERKIKRPIGGITTSFLEKVFEDIKEEARIWLMQQSEVQK